MVPEVTTIVIVQILDIQVMKTIMLFFVKSISFERMHTLNHFYLFF